MEEWRRLTIACKLKDRSDFLFFQKLKHKTCFTTLTGLCIITIEFVRIANIATRQIFSSIYQDGFDAAESEFCSRKRFN